jgi:hypothetical protein
MKLIEAANWNYTQFIMSQIHYELYPINVSTRKKIAHWKELKTLKPYTHIANFQVGEKLMSPN